MKFFFTFFIFCIISLARTNEESDDSIEISSSPESEIKIQADPETESSDESITPADEKPQQTIGTVLHLNEGNFTQHVVKSNYACLVYFTTLEKEKKVEQEFSEFADMFQEINGALKVAVFRYQKNTDDTYEKQVQDFE